MEGIKKGLNFISEILGFKRNNKYVRNYLNDANIKSSIYMGFIIIVIEIWMIVRSHNKYVIPAVNAGADYLDTAFSYTSLYWLFLISSLAVMLFSIYYIVVKIKKGKTKTDFIPSIVAGALIAYSFCVIKEISNFKSWDSTYYKVSNLGVIFLYVCAALLGAAILWHSIYRYKNKQNSMLLSMVVIVLFAAMCLVFGVKVGYSDFFSKFNLGTGLPTPANVAADGTPIYEIKSIICFLTMLIYVACLLIWKPYISIILLTSVFAGFAILLNGDSVNRVFADGERVNYITFLISLSMISISIYQQRIEEAKKDEKLIHDAAYDLLTEVHSVNYLTYTVAELQKSDPKACEDKLYLFINLTNFRAINIQQGFDAGNKFIIQLGRDIEAVFDGDIVSRQADDHFVVFTDVKYYQDKIDMLDAIIQKRVGRLYIQLKIGGYVPKPNDDPMRSIDRARYACNLIGNKYGVNFLMFDEEVRHNLVKHQYIINHLDEAIENDYIQPYYQPVVWSKNRELCGAEALARWIDPVYGFLSPGEFVPILEESRLIHKLDKCIIDKVCRNMRTAIDEGKPVVPVSVNFSRLDFELMHVDEVLNEALTKYNIDKHYIHVEITESALSDDTDFLNKIIGKLKQEGYAIWLDDFGSGYSSLNVLKDFMFDVIKIDMKFLSNFENNDKSRDILDCIIQLANRLGMKTLTEGVETKEEADFLEEIGCGRLQGYLFGKPYKLDDFEAMIKEQKLTVSKTIL